MLNLRRGFKNEANELAREVRGALGLSQSAPLDPWQLATHLGITVIPMSDLSGAASHSVSYFTQVETSAFSAVTVFAGHHRMIVQNDSHVAGRQTSDVSHELAHAILLHPPTPAIGDHGCREWNPVVEQEAEWLSGALLVPEEAAMSIVRQQLTIPEAASVYGVTPKLMSFRISFTGAQKRVSRAKAFRGGR